MYACSKVQINQNKLGVNMCTFSYSSGKMFVLGLAKKNFVWEISDFLLPTFYLDAFFYIL